MENFKTTGLTIDGMVNIICYEKDIRDFLLDIQQSYRIERSLTLDEGNVNFYKAQAIDEIIQLMSWLEQARQQYMEEKKKQEEQKKKEELAKKKK